MDYGRRATNSSKHDHNDSDKDQSVSYGRKKEPGSSNKGGKGKFDKSKIRCYNCQGWGHFANECGSKDVREKRIKCILREWSMVFYGLMDMLLVVTVCEVSVSGFLNKDWFKIMNNIYLHGR